MTLIELGSADLEGSHRGTRAAWPALSDRLVYLPREADVSGEARGVCEQEELARSANATLALEPCTGRCLVSVCKATSPGQHRPGLENSRARPGVAGGRRG